MKLKIDEKIKIWFTKEEGKAIMDFIGVTTQHERFEDFRVTKKQDDLLINIHSRLWDFFNNK